MQRTPHHIALLSALAVVLTGSVALAQDGEASAPVEPVAGDGVAYPVSEFRLTYFRENDGHPSLDALRQVTIQLTPTEAGFVAPRADAPAKSMTVAELSADQPRTFYASAIQRILERLRDELTARHIVGVYVAPDPQQINEQGEDLRPDGDTTLRIIITTGIVTEVRTLAHGDRVPDDERLNHDLHQRIAGEAPIGVEPDPETGRDRNLIRKDQLDDYVLMLSRHPGRRVDVALAPAPQLGGVTLDLLVTEVKPWLVYAQLSNTGTRNTDRLREQFGFRHYNLTNNDDILAIDYATANFEDAHSVTASYEARLFGMNRARWRVFGGYNEYTASDVGLFSDTFEGESYQFGGEIIWNFYQQRALFLDAVFGARYEHLRSEDTIPGSLDGSEGLLIPYVGLRVEQYEDWSTLLASATLEAQDEGLSGAAGEQFQRFGRAEVDESWMLLRGDASFSVFVEPLIDLDAWRDPATPESSTLAHELYFRVAGQTTFGRRVLPQFESVAGGLYTVRGYEESVAAGDSILMGTAEYRFHLPKVLEINPEPDAFLDEPFRISPQQVYGPTDWDLILRGFVDAALVHSEDGTAIGEDGSTLIGAGVGLEVQFKRNITARVDWGVVLHDVPGEAEVGDNRVHFVITLLY